MWQEHSLQVVMKYFRGSPGKKATGCRISQGDEMPCIRIVGRCIFCPKNVMDTSQSTGSALPALREIIARPLPRDSSLGLQEGRVPFIPYLNVSQ